MAHRDVMQPSPPEILRDDVVPGHDMTTPHPPNAGAAWTMPPMASGMGGGYMTGMAGDGVRHVRGYDAAKLRDSIKGTSGFADV